MTEWRECKLKDVCKYERISINPQKYKILQFVHYSFPAFDNNKTPEIQFGGQIKSSKYIVKKGYILYNKLNVRFKRIWNINFETPENSICSSEFLPILATKCNQDYLYYFLCSDELTDTMANSNTGTSGSHQRIDPNFLMKYDILLPPLPEQKAIAEVLSSLDDKIDLLTRQNKTLEDLAQAYFRKWFIEDASDEWEVGKLGDYIEIHDSKRVPLSKIEREKMKSGTLYPYYGAATIMDYVNDYIFDGEYILMGEDGTVETEDGYPVLQYATGKFWVNNHAHVLTAKSPFNNYFIWFFLKQCNISGIVTGAVQPKINQENLKNIDIPIPDLTLINSANQFFANIFAKILNNLEQIKTFQKLRDTLLPKLISGEIRVKM